MNGKVILAREPVVSLVIVDDPGETWEIDCLVDTGCTSELTLPPDAIAEIGLAYLRDDQAIVADRRVVMTKVFRARILWNGGIRDVEVVELDREPLIGMQLLEDHRLAMDVIDGGDVSIHPL